MPPDRAALSARSIFGLAVVALGVLLTLSNLGLIDGDDFWEYWPAVFLLIGAGRLSSGDLGKGLFWLALGTAFLLPVVFEELEWEDLFDYWPVFLVALGLHMVVRSFFPRPARRPRRAQRPASREADAPDLDATALLSSLRRSVTATDFRRGSLTAVMGGCDVDLTAAGLAPEGAEIEIFAFWGGVTLRIPDDWEVDSRLAVFMGALEDRTEPRATAGGRLTISGVALMGGLEIRH